MSSRFDSWDNNEWVTKICRQCKQTTYSSKCPKCGRQLNLPLDMMTASDEMALDGTYPWKDAKEFFTKRNMELLSRYISQLFKTDLKNMNSQYDMMQVCDTIAGEIELKKEHVSFFLSSIASFLAGMLSSVESGMQRKSYDETYNELNKLMMYFYHQFWETAKQYGEAPQPSDDTNNQHEVISWFCGCGTETQEKTCPNCGRDLTGAEKK